MPGGFALPGIFVLRAGQVSVAQIGNLLCRRLVIGRS